ncbi:hypothetical protein Tco_1313742 [Tanacetum coccineum]
MVVNDDSQRWSTVVNTAGPPSDHRSTATVNGGGPPLTTAEPPVNQRVMAGYWVGSGQVMGRVWIGSGRGQFQVMGRVSHVACHVDPRVSHVAADVDNEGINPQHVSNR